MPEVDAIVSWSDDERHKGTIYRSSNFKETGKSGGNLHGTGTKRKDGGYYRLNKDFRHIKTRFLYKFDTTVRNSEDILENMVLDGHFM